jgi:hypothetical protein
MKRLFCFLVLTLSLATEAQVFHCRKPNPADYEVGQNVNYDYCFMKKDSGSETGTWDIELILDRKKEKISYKDGSGNKRQCRPKFNFTDESLLIMRCTDGFALPIVKYCSDSTRFFGVTESEAGKPFGINGGDYFVECKLVNSNPVEI